MEYIHCHCSIPLFLFYFSLRSSMQSKHTSTLFTKIDHRELIWRSLFDEWTKDNSQMNINK